MEVNFKPENKTIICKSRPVPLGFLEDLNDAYEKVIRKGVWKPMVPVQKAICPGQTKRKIRDCWDYSVTVNSQLETHR